MSFDLNLSEDQRQIVDTLDAVLAASYPLGRLRDGTSENLAPLAEFGAFILSAQEADGGAGLSVVEEALVHTRLGRHVVSTRALATTLGAAIARAAGDGELAAAIAGLDRTICIALRGPDDILLSDDAGAELAVLFDGRELSLVEVANAVPAAGLGHSLALSRMTTGARMLHRAGEKIVALADLLVSAQLLGVAEGARDLAVAYAGMRQQFGKPIGAFQAIKHHAADMAIGAEMVSAQLDMAAIALADGRPDALFQIAALRRLAPVAALANARACIQIHGGIGFSAEADAHHFIKHAHLLSRLGAAPSMLDPDAPMAPLHERN